jgi:hypothetical protein
VMHESRDGAALNTLLDRFGPQCIDLLEILLQFGFIRQVHSYSAMPVFVSDLYGSPITSHYWVRIDGSIDVAQRDHIIRSVYEIVEAHPGIELLPLLSSIRILALSDVLAILNCLELDELIFRVVTTTAGTNLSLSDPPILQAPISDFLIGAEISESLTNMSCQRSSHRFFPRLRCPI